MSLADPGHVRKSAFQCSHAEPRSSFRRHHEKLANSHEVKGKWSFAPEPSLWAMLEKLQFEVQSLRAAQAVRPSQASVELLLREELRARPSMDAIEFAIKHHVPYEQVQLAIAEFERRGWISRAPPEDEEE